jgi:hypothetical protein
MPAVRLLRPPPLAIGRRPAARPRGSRPADTERAGVRGVGVTPHRGARASRPAPETRQEGAEVEK